MVKNKEVIFNKRRGILALSCAAMLLNIPTALLADRDRDSSSAQSQSSAFEISSASWNADRSSLRVLGTGQRGATISVVNAATMQAIGSDNIERSRWKITSRDPSSVPCSIEATQSDGQSAVLSVANAPADCDTVAGGGDSVPGDANGDGGGNIAGGTPPTPPVIPNVSINSTSQNGLPGSPVAEQPLIGQAGYQIFAINDLGMHCGDFDTRISSILPPFNVLHATVIQRGAEPTVLTPADGVEVYYSAASNPDDPILSGINSAGTGDVYSSMLPSGRVFKTNFWDIARDAMDPFYPAGILPAFYPAGPLADILDLGLPAPNVEQLHLGDGNLTADQQSMPGRHAPYVDNMAERFEAYVVDQAFFTNPAFQFGYVKEGVNWYEAPGIPLAAFDDFGRENPWPLYRVQAVQNGTVLASTDTVVPISGEANCGSCHNSTFDGGNGAATNSLAAAGIQVATVLDDPQLDSVPLEVSKEYAADTNLIRLHDLKHGSGNPNGAKYTPDLVDQTPIVCQSCHYTPALDLAQLGPLGPENDGPLVLNGVTISDSLANGRQQVSNKSMSNVMHSHHGSVTDANGNKLFPEMPPAIKDDLGMIVNFQERRDALEATCYQCHPGRRTDCLRGAMSNGGMLCQDCHGNMDQVGDDFTRNVSADNPGAFELGGDYYTNPDQPRVPWANEPGCGACHTGDAMNNLAGTPGTVVNNYDADANIDDIRLFQAFRSDDPKATPIVPTNKRFAENVIDANNPAVSGPDDPRIGNPMLYRVSTGHRGIFCEACHGSTHGIWPNKNPLANDNVTSNQLQGHTGTITECDTCHEGDLGNTLGGPHGMHPVGDTSFSDGGHENMAESNADDCRACHGVNGEGTVLSRAATDRVLSNEGETVTIAKGEPVTCTHCHENEL